MLRGTWYYNKEIKVENGLESAKIVTNVQTFRDCALHRKIQEMHASHLSSRDMPAARPQC